MDVRISLSSPLPAGWLVGVALQSSNTTSVQVVDTSALYFNNDNATGFVPVRLSVGLASSTSELMALVTVYAADPSTGAPVAVSTETVKVSDVEVGPLYRLEPEPLPTLFLAWNETSGAYETLPPVEVLVVLLADLAADADLTVATVLPAGSGNASFVCGSSCTVTFPAGSQRGDEATLTLDLQYATASDSDVLPSPVVIGFNASSSSPSLDAIVTDQEVSVEVKEALPVVLSGVLPSPGLLPVTMTVGGYPVPMTVQLSEPAPPGGLYVELSFSPYEAEAVPNPVYVQGGSSAAPTEVRIVSLGSAVNDSTPLSIFGRVVDEQGTPKSGLFPLTENPVTPLDASVRILVDWDSRYATKVLYVVGGTTVDVRVELVESLLAGEVLDVQVRLSNTSLGVLEGNVMRFTPTTPASMWFNVTAPLLTTGTCDLIVEQTLRRAGVELTTRFVLGSYMTESPAAPDVVVL